MEKDVLIFGVPFFVNLQISKIFINFVFESGPAGIINRLGGKFTLSQSINLNRKFKPALIFTGTEMLDGDQVLVTSASGTILDIIPRRDAGDDIQELDGILSPGFVNAHCHIELSHMKGVIPMHTGLVEFVKQIILKRESTLPGTSPEEHFEKLLDLKHDAMDKAVEELWNSGSVAIGDICNTADSIELKANSNLYWHNFIEVSGFVDAVAKKRLTAAESILASFNTRHSHFGNTITPHAPYSVSRALFNLLNEQTSGNIISIHNQEAQAENELYLQKTGDFLGLYKDLGINIDSFLPTGRSSLRSWLPLFTHNQKIISAHNTFMSDTDLQALPGILGNKVLFFCVCINANLYIENRLPPLEMMVSHHCNIVLGTDSYASNQQLNMLEEIKTIRSSYPQFSLATILQWATLNGAKALGIESKFGSFEKGKTPGLVLIKKDLSGSQLLRPGY